MENAKEVIKEVKDSVNQRKASRKDEITVMKAMINDPDYTVKTYDKDGQTEEYYPGREFRRVVTNVVASTTKITNREAAELVNSYDFTKSDAAALVGLSKEFVHTYLQTGRKLPIGGRETSNVELIWRTYEKRVVGIPANEERTEWTTTTIPAHDGIKTYNQCPPWVK